MGICFRKVQSDTLTIGFNRESNPERPNNAISTTKYNLLTFFPKALILQFTRAANFVYLVSAVLQTISLISSLAPITAIGPLMFVLSVGIAREGYEDYKRHEKDVEVNNRKSQRLKDGRFEEIPWEQIHAGDIIKVTNNQIIPCDMVVLYTTEQNSICYVETANLDGESNLKTKFAFVDEIFLYPDQFQLLDGFLEVDNPNSDLYEFNGKITLTNHQPKDLSFENLLLRQTLLKNTTEVVGVAVYCGTESKIMMNKGHIQHKITKVEKRVNVIQLFLFLVLVLLCTACSVGFYITHNNIGRENFFYLKTVDLSLEVEALLIFFTCFLLLNFLIPISLNVLIEFIKAVLALFLGFDNSFKDRFCPDGIHVSNMSIVEELGVVDYVLTDKTGTLTSNEMVFKSCCVNDQVYEVSAIESQIEKLSSSSSFHNFWICVVLCHDVVKDSERNKFQGSSPDQVCFVEYAKTIGYEFIKRTKNYVELNIRGEKTVYELLHMFPFNSRRRMSVIVKAICDENDILLFTKGADSAIFEKSTSYKYQDVFTENINEYAKQGLRTLVFSYRKINKAELDDILKTEVDMRYAKLHKSMTIEEIDQVNKDLMERIQSGLNILGASAIEDKLQDKVPQTIARLQEAGITVMMITGDKLETAENIGYLASFIKRNSKVHKVKSTTVNIAETIANIVEQINNNFEEHVCVLIEGSSIRKIVEEQDPEKVELYTELMTKSSSIIFCRSSPKQKALIVKFVKKNLKGTVLAIGDGGNDTSMIEEANVGIGIMGKEGNSAAAVSDFYFGQFKHLDRLLLHHGRWFYFRLSYFFVYYGWKNLIMTVLMFFFILRSAFSGFPGFSEFYIVMYNLLIGMFIISYYGVWAQDINDDLHPDVWKQLPSLYKESKEVDLFSYQRYLLWSVSGLIIAVLLEFYIDLAIGTVSATIGDSGFPFTYDGIYVVKGIALIIVTFTVVLMDLRSFTVVTLGLFIGFLTFFFVILVYILENSFNFGRGYLSLVDNSDSKLYFVLLIILGVSIGVKYATNVLQIELYPTQVDKILLKKHQKGELQVFGNSYNQIIPTKEELQINRTHPLAAASSKKINRNPSAQLRGIPPSFATRSNRLVVSELQDRK